MIRLPPRSTRTDTLFPYTTLFRSLPTPDPTSGSFSQKQPPACESSQKLAASPDQLCSFDHQLCGIRSIFHTSAGVAATCDECATVKPISRWSMTLAVAAPEYMDAPRPEARRVGKEWCSTGR